MFVSSLNGMNACVLAYGQTGSGKTHTVFGPSGAIEQCAEQVKTKTRAERREARRVRRRPRPRDHQEYRSRSSARDDPLWFAPPSPSRLLGSRSRRVTCNDLRRSLVVLRHGSACAQPSIADGDAAATPSCRESTHVELRSLTDALALLRAGELHKRVAATAIGHASSRAHTVFLVTFTQRGTHRAGHDGAAEPGDAADLVAGRAGEPRELREFKQGRW